MILLLKTVCFTFSFWKLFTCALTVIEFICSRFCVYFSVFCTFPWSEAKCIICIAFLQMTAMRNVVVLLKFHGQLLEMLVNNAYTCLLYTSFWRKAVVLVCIYYNARCVKLFFSERPALMFSRSLSNKEIESNVYTKVPVSYKVQNIKTK